MGILNNNIKRKSRRRNRSKSTSMFHSKYPRLVIYRSNKHFESQIVNDFEANTLVSSSSKDSSLKKKLKALKVKLMFPSSLEKLLLKKLLRKNQKRSF